jgi:glutamate synthase domain-containing protein 2
MKGTVIGKDALSPNQHVDISSFDDLIEMVNHVRKITGKPTGFKMVVGAPIQLEKLLSVIRIHARRLLLLII